MQCNHTCVSFHHFSNHLLERLYMFRETFVAAQYFIVMARGVYDAHAFVKEDFHAESQELAAACVRQLPRILNRMFGASAQKPKIIFSDRGPGFYHRRYGVVTSDYDAMRPMCGFQLWAGTNSLQGPHRQPADIADVLLHETANSWLATRLDKGAASLDKPWEETPGDFAKRLSAAVRDLNRTCDVDQLCKDFPERLRQLVKRKGDRLES